MPAHRPKNRTSSFPVLRAAAFGMISTMLVQLLLCVLPFRVEARPRLLRWTKPGPLYDEDEILVDFQDDTTPEQVAELAHRYGIRLQPNSIHSSAEVLTRAVLPAGLDLDKLVVRLGADPLVEFAERDALYYASMQPDDPKYTAQWHMRLIDMEGAWELSRGSGAVVAVIDTGTSEVPDLAGMDWVPGYDFVDDDEDPRDDHGHGTHVAGTVAQRTNNGIGVTGVAFAARIMALRVLDARGMGQTGDIADAIRFAADHGAQVINLSLGGGARSAILEDAIGYALGRGVVVVAAAGNDGRGQVSLPAAYPGVLAVSAVDALGKRAFYSNFGSAIDLAGPGGDTNADHNNDGLPDGVMQNTIVPGHPEQDDYPLLMGTSMAAPHVAGAAALLFAAGVTDGDRVVALLQGTARDVGEPGRDDHYGHGIVDPTAALSRARLLGGLGPLLLALALLALLGVRLRRSGAMEQGVITSPFLLGALLMAASGLFLLPWLIGSPHQLLGLLSEPIASWGLVLLGPGWHLCPLLASALLPLAAAVLLAGIPRGARICAGLALGFGGLLLWSTLFGQADVIWIPGRALDRVWLAANGLFCVPLATVLLKRR